MKSSNLPRVRILVVNAHSALRKGFCSMLQSYNALFTIYEATNRQQGLQLLHETQPELVLLDATLPQLEYVEATCLFKNIRPEVKILAIASTEADFFQAFRAGADGCVSENIEAEELLHAVELLLSGYLVYRKLISRTLVDDITQSQDPKSSRLDVQLTGREVEILSLIAHEYTNTEIAKCLSISPRTVDSHRARLMQKLGTKNTAGLIRIAIQQGLLQESNAEADNSNLYPIRAKNSLT